MRTYLRTLSLGFLNTVFDKTSGRTRSVEICPWPWRLAHHWASVRGPVPGNGCALGFSLRQSLWQKTYLNAGALSGPWEAAGEVPKGQQTCSGDGKSRGWRLPRGGGAKDSFWSPNLHNVEYVNASLMVWWNSTSGRQGRLRSEVETYIGGGACDEEEPDA